jgi:hypothetical protein
LVVEGLLLTDTTPCKVTLSYSGIFNSAGAQAQNYVDDATVFVKDNTGDSTKLTNIGNGDYVSTSNINAKPGGSYSVSITLSNGKKYASIPETIAPVPQNFSLDSVGEVMSGTVDGLYAADIEIKTQDPANQKNFYRWISTDFVSRKSTGISCGINSPPCFQYCFQYYQDNSVYILSDANINGKEIRYQTALISPYYYYGNHYIQLKQLSLTAQAYQFWLLYQQQTTRTGSILDPLPSPLQGNIYNINDSTELALGYFEASDVASIQFILSPIFINAYYTLAGGQDYIATGACYLVYPDATTYAPPGWGSAPQYIINVY